MLSMRAFPFRCGYDELCRFESRDIDVKERLVFERSGKRGKDRVMPIRRSMAERIVRGGAKEVGIKKGKPVLSVLPPYHPYCRAALM